jgi:hypothetical protein
VAQKTGPGHLSTREEPDAENAVAISFVKIKNGNQRLNGSIERFVVMDPALVLLILLVDVQSAGRHMKRALPQREPN